MKQHLYNIFANTWLQNNRAVYFYGDPHFGDLDSYKYFRFPELFVNTTEEQDKETIAVLDKMQIDNINRICGRNSTLVILGDVGNIECIRKLRPEYKVLIMGNHDRGASCYQRRNGFIDRTKKNEFGKYIWNDGDNKLFNEVYEGTLQISPKILLSHEPVESPYWLNIHGHIHGSKEYKHIQPTINNEFCYSLNCIAEVLEYKPKSLNQIVKEGHLSTIQDIHQTAIDKATQTKVLKKLLHTIYE